MSSPTEVTSGDQVTIKNTPNTGKEESTTKNDPNDMTGVNNQDASEKKEEVKENKGSDFELTPRNQSETKSKGFKGVHSKHQDTGSTGGQAEKNDATAILLSETEERGFQDPINLPRDAKLISLLIKAEGIIDYEPRIIPQLLEFMHKYTFDMIKDAQVYAEHANNKEITLDDLRMSVEARITHSFTVPPCRETNLRLVEEINSKPVPIVPCRFGVVLPLEKYTLTGSNFQISIGKKKSTRQVFDDIDIKPGVTVEDKPKDSEPSEQNEPLLTLDPPAKKRLETSDEDYDSFV